MTLVILMLFMSGGVINIASFLMPEQYVYAATEDTATEDESVDDTSSTDGETEIDKEHSQLLIDECDAYTTVYQNDDGTKTSRFYSVPIRYLDDEGNYVDFDTSLTELSEEDSLIDEGKLKYKTKSSDVETYLPETFSEDSPIVVKYNDYSITLLPLTSDGKIDADYGTSEDASDIEKELAKDEKQSLKTNNGNAKTEEVTDLYDEVSEETTAVTYTVVDENNNGIIDYEYIPDQFGFKENIILYENTGVNTFEFYLEVKGCYAKLDEYGSVMIYDQKTDESVGQVPFPYIIDADGKENKEEAYSEAVHYELIEKATGKYYLNVVVSDEYLNDPDTAYPITIDPSLTMVGSDQMKTAYVMSGSYANTNYWGVRVMRCGYSSSMGCMTRTYITFPTLQGAINNQVVTSATFYAKEYDNSYPFADMTLYRVTEPWYLWSVTWNNQPAAQWFADIEPSRASGWEWHDWNVTRIVSKWASTAWANYGFQLRATQESTSVANRVDLYSPTTTATTCRPYLTVTHQDPTTLDAPTVTSAGVNSGYSHVELDFSKVIGASKYELIIEGDGGGSDIIRDITDEITLSDNIYTWKSSDYSTIFSGYIDTEFPNSSAGPLGGTGAYKFSIKTSNIYDIGVISSVETVTLYDNTRPNSVANPTATQAQDPNNTGKAVLNVTFNQATDLPSGIASGIDYYKIKCYQWDPNTNGYTYITGLNKDYNSSASSYSHQFTNISDNSYYVIQVVVYDNNGNYSVYSNSSFISVPNYTPPGAPKDLKITPSNWTDIEDENDNPIETRIEWGEIDEGTDDICRIEYSLDGTNYTTTGKSSEKTSFALSEEVLDTLIEGETTIYVRAVTHNADRDPAYLYGAPSQVVYKKDTISPTVSLSGLTEDQQVETNLIVNGVINDTNITSWEVSVTSYHWLVVEEETIVCDSTGLSPAEMNINGQICIIDLSDPDYGISLNKEFKLTVTATDAARHTTSVDYMLTRVESASNINTVFEIDNATDIVNEQWLIDQTETTITPIALPGETLPVGTNELFIDNELTANVNDEMVLNISDENIFTESSEHYALVKITDSQGDTYYNASTHEQAVLNDDLMASDWETITNIDISSTTAALDNSLTGVIESFRTDLSGNLVEFTINSVENLPSGTSINYYVKFDPEGSYIQVNPNTRYHVEDLLSGSIDAYSIQLKVEMNTTTLGTSPSITDLTIDNLYVNAGEKFIINMMDNIAPSNLSVEENVNYMSYLTWDAGSEADSFVTYEIYRSEDESDLYSENNIIKTGISDTYWYDYNLDYGTTFHYGVKAVKTIDQIVRKSDASNTFSGTVVAANELDKRLGLQDYWGYSNFDTIVGTGYIEQSEGNLVYQESDAQVPGTLLGLVLRRTYNSQSTTTTPMGTGWDFSFNTCLYVSYDATGENEEGMILKDGDGTFHYFNLEDDGTYSSPQGVHMQLEYVNDDHYEIYRSDNITYVFNDSNQLESMSEPNGNALTFVYDSATGNLSSVTTSNGDAITFTYNAFNQLTCATLPDGTEVQYTYIQSNNRYVIDNITIEGTEGDTLERDFGYTNGLLSVIKDGMPQPNQYDLTYNTGGIFASVEYPDNNVMSITYGSGVTTTNIYEDGVTTEVVSTSSAIYNDYGNITGTIDPSGQEMTYAYDDDFNMTSLSYDYFLDSLNETTGQIEHTCQLAEYKYSYDDKFNVTSVEQPDGLIISYLNYNTFNKPTSMTVSKSGCATLETEYTYDVYGNLETETDPLNKTIEYDYAANGSLISQSDRFGNATTYTYNSDGQLTDTTLSEETVSVLSYDDMWRPITTQDAEGNKTHYEYDYLGNVTVVIYGYDDGDPSNDVTYQYGYNENNQMDYSQDPLSYTQRYTYDSMGRQIATVINESRTYSTEYSYEDITVTDIAFLGENFGSVTYENAYKVVQKLPNGLMSSVSYYDSSGRLIKQAGDGVSTIYFYDERGLAIKAVDNTGGVVRVIYDEMGKQTHAIIKNGSSYIDTETSYDYLGNVVSTTDGIGVTTTNVYDELNRLLSVTLDGDTTSYTYDNDGFGGIYNETTDANGRKSISVFDEFGNKIKQIEYSDNTNSTYKTTTYEYDANGNLIRLTNPDSTVVEYSYDGRGNCTEIVQKASLNASESLYRTVYEYYLDDTRKSMRDYQTIDGTEEEITWTTYAYDGFGQVSEVVQDGSPVFYTYNYDGTIDTIQYCDNAYVPDGYTGDPDDNEYASNETFITIQYDYIYDQDFASSFLSSVNVIMPATTTELTVRQYNYDSTTRRVSSIVDYPGFDTASSTPVTQEYTYNDLGLVSELSYSQGGVEKESYSYTYNDRGFITAESITNDYFDDAKDSSFSYTYDDVGHLTQSVYTDNNTSNVKTTSYTYDAVGNRTSKSDDSFTYTYTIGAYNQVGTVTKKDSSNTTVETSTFTYDTNGTLDSEVTSTFRQETQIGNTFDVKDTVTKMYEYDPTGMMTSSQVDFVEEAKLVSEPVESYEEVDGTSDSASDSYVYSGDGQRTKKLQDGKTYKYYYTGSVILYTADADNNKISANIMTPSGEIIATRDFSYTHNEDGSVNQYAHNYYFYHYDIRGSVTTILKPNATIEQGYTYDEFGNSETVSETSLLTNEVSYTGAISDTTTGLTYMNARYYNPATGSFTSQDTYLGSAYNPQSQHLYSYTGGNPINFIDPTGHKIDFLKLIGGIALAVVGCAMVASGVGAGVGVGTIVAAIGVISAVVGASEITEVATGDNPIKRVVGEEIYEPVKQGCEIATSVWSCAQLGGTLYRGFSELKNGTAYYNSLDDVVYVAENAGNLADDILKFGSDTKSSTKLYNQMDTRGWTEDLIKNTVNSPYTTRVSTNLATGNSATAYYSNSGAYVIVDDITREIVQISDRLNPSTWIPDVNIIDPFIK